MDSENLFGSSGLTDLRVRSGNDMRPELLRVLTDLYVQRLSHSAAEERHYTELALRMLQVVDVPTRVAVAKRFARYLSPPLRVLQWLAADVPQVAAELADHPLMQPRSAAEQIADQPPTATLGDDGLASRHMAAPDAGELTDLFFNAHVEERRLILLNLDIIAADAAELAPITADASINQHLELAALAGDSEGFARQLAGALQISHDNAQRITHDNFGEPVVVAAKALNMPREMLYRILLFINPAVGRSVERVQALAALYDEISGGAAASIVEIWRASQRQEPPASKHRPLLYDDEKRRGARAGAATQSRGSVVSRPSARRTA